MGDVSAMATSVPAFGSTDASENEERDEELSESSKNQFKDEQEYTASSSKGVMGRTSRRWRAEKPQTLPLMSGSFARKQTFSRCFTALPHWRPQTRSQIL
jgi:hypothetical protein